MQVLENLLEKAVTAPFALFAPGGGEQPSSIEFAPGSAELNAAAQARLTTLATALYDRPALQLEIAGPGGCRSRSRGVETTDAEQKTARRNCGNWRPGQTTDECNGQPCGISRPAWAAVYQDEDFAKPRNLIGLAKELPLAEMENCCSIILMSSPTTCSSLAPGCRALPRKMH